MVYQYSQLVHGMNLSGNSSLVESHVSVDLRRGFMLHNGLFKVVFEIWMLFCLLHSTVFHCPRAHCVCARMPVMRSLAGIMRGGWRHLRSQRGRFWRRSYTRYTTLKCLRLFKHSLEIHQTTHNEEICVQVGLMLSDAWTMWDKIPTQSYIIIVNICWLTKTMTLTLYLLLWSSQLHANYL